MFDIWHSFFVSRDFEVGTERVDRHSQYDSNSETELQQEPRNVNIK